MLLLLLAFLLILRAEPIWTMGLYQDDSVISSYRYEALLQGRGMWEYCVDTMRSMFRYQGRIAPLFSLVVMPLQAWVGENLLIYRVITGAAQLAALLCFYATTKVLSRSFHFAVLCAGMFAAIFEVRDFHDSSHSYFIFIPYVVAIGSLSCYFASKALATRRPFAPLFWLVPILNLAGMLMYELASVFALASCVILLAGAYPRRTRLLRAAIAAAPVVMVLGAGILARHTASQYEGTQLGNLAPSVVFAAYLKHLSAALPLSYWWKDPQHYFTNLLFDMRSQPVGLLRAGAAGLAAGLLVLLAAFRIRSEPPPALWAMGAFLLLLPSLMISMSRKYQVEAVAGVGYLQNSLSYLGLVIVVSGVVSLVVVRLGRHSGARTLLAFGFAVVVAAVASVSLLSSFRVAAAINRQWRDPREQLETWMSATRPQGLGDHLLVLDQDWLHRWEWPPFMLQHWGVKGSFATLRDFNAKPPTVPTGTRVTILRPARNVDPSALALFIDSTLDPSGQRVRGIVMSKRRDSLADNALWVAGDGAMVPFASEVHVGPHGYFYREAMLDHSGANLRTFALVIGVSGQVAPFAPVQARAGTAALQWKRGRYDDGWTSDTFELVNAGSVTGEFRLSLRNPAPEPRSYRLQAAGRTVQGELPKEGRANVTVTVPAGGSVVGTVSPAYVPQAEGRGPDDRKLGLRLEFR